MKYHALVVDDNPDVLDDVKDRLESIGHSCDCVTCLQCSRDHLAKNSYSYILLDLEIPVRYGRPSRIANGQNLLREIRAMKGYEHIPVIVMTCHGTDGPDLAVDVMRKGATNYVKKPFPKSGRTLDEAIKSALTPPQASHGANGTPKPAGNPRPFAGGELTLFEHHAELCGVRIIEASNRGHGWDALQALSEVRNGKPVPRSGEQLAKLIDKRMGENTIAKSISALRKRIAATMLRECNVTVGKHDVICNKGHGYRLNPDKITVRQGHAGMSPPTHVPANVPGDTAPGTGTSQGQGHDRDTLNERQDWFIAELRAGRSPQRADIEDKFDCSDKTAKRDLGDLRDRGIVAFVPTPRPGHYRLKQAAAHADRRASLAAVAS
ncbi:MAG: response regulator [Phycisphaerae bacterium]